MQSAGFVPFEEASLSWDAKCIRRTLHRSSQFPCLPLPPSSRSPFSSSSSFFPFLPLQREKDKSITPRALSRVNGNSMEKWLSGRALSILSCRYHLTSYSLARFLATKCEKERPFLSVPITPTNDSQREFLGYGMHDNHLNSLVDKGTLSAFLRLPIHEKKSIYLFRFDFSVVWYIRVREKGYDGISFLPFNMLSKRNLVVQLF